jgi:alpha-galactosidase
MIESGMVAAGYTQLSTTCTGWLGRDPVTHELQQNLTNWPGGMKSFADYLHSKGMILMVYSDAGVKNCCQEPGSLGYEALDMKTFASWGVDSVGVDYCGGPRGEGAVQIEYQKFADGIVNSVSAAHCFDVAYSSAHSYTMHRAVTCNSGCGIWALDMLRSGRPR